MLYTHRVLYGVYIYIYIIVGFLKDDSLKVLGGFPRVLKDIDGFGVRYGLYGLVDSGRVGGRLQQSQQKLLL